MPYANVNGVNLYYEDYGSGPTVILTPGGRVDHNGLRPIAALLSPHCRVILHDRRNCGKSDVVIGGELSEQHIWAEEMAALLEHLDATPADAAGGRAGSRPSLTLAYRHPEAGQGGVLWGVGGGRGGRPWWGGDVSAVGRRWAKLAAGKMGSRAKHARAPESGLRRWREKRRGSGSLARGRGTSSKPVR